QLSLMFDLERCIGCKSCEAACKQEHGLGPGEFRNRVVWLGDEDEAALDFLTVTCQHCERPACLRACPVNPKAISKDPETGVVSVDEDRCTGCGECVTACPYGAMGYDSRGHHAVKCDLCSDRRSEGLEPACSSVCPGRAITFGERSAHLARAKQEGRSVRNHDSFLLGPASVYLDRIDERKGTTLLERRRPAVVDPPEAQAAFEKKGAEFPYGWPRSERKPDRVEPGSCTLCFNTCSVKFHFAGDKLVKITGNEEDPILQGRVCPKSQHTLQMYHNERRLTQPLKRVGERGAGKFEPISWEQALNEIATKLEPLRQNEPEALGIFAGTRTGMITIRGYIRMFGQMWGTPNLETTDPFCAAGKNITYQMTHGANGCGNSYTDDDIGSAGMYLYIGDNQAETRPVYFGMVNDWRVTNGAKMVVVDPRYSATASKADRWHSIRPGTDMALGLAMSQHIFAQGLHDQRYCENWIEGWEKWRDFLNEQGYTPDWAMCITDIAADDIKRLAEDVAKADGCVIFCSRGINQHTNSAQTNRVFMFLAAMTGNWGRKGGAYMNMSFAPTLFANAPLDRQPPVTKAKIRKSPAGWTDAMLHGKPYPLKALIAGNNPMSQWPDQAATRKAFKALDLLVHIDLFQNETSAYADYVLPAAPAIEAGDIGRANDDRRIVWVDRLIEPPGEAKPDAWIWTELGKRFGFGDVLKEEYKDTAKFWDAEMINHRTLWGLTQKRLHANPWRWVRFPLASEDAEEQETLFLEGTTADGAAEEGFRFATANGKLQFWTAELDANFRTMGLTALPVFYSEREQLVDLPYVQFEEGDDADGIISPFYPNTLAVPGRIISPNEETPGGKLRREGYDMELVTGRPPAPHFHSWTHYFWQSQEMWPDLYAQIHPEKASALALSDGEKVRIETAHGEIEARAWITPGIRKTSVFVPIGWGEKQPYHPWRSVNFMTDKTQRDPISDQTNLKTLLCRVEKT
ncbi:MAG: hypothetical protein CFH10_00458, partial [Alphaproteobacteria bacterium MarineAlpha4_Bin2]